MQPNIDKIGKYPIASILGQGGMGVVYKGYDLMIERYVAVKTIRNEVLGDKEIQLRFIREAKIAGRLQHPNIVSVYEYGEDNGQIFIAMEYVDGRPLSTYMKEGYSFDINWVCNIMTKILSALDYAHSMNITHRDIKPANILITGSDEVKIVDFGIARLESSTLTRVGVVLGTPNYMSPEQILGESIDHRADLFSVGLLLYELLTHEKAFGGGVDQSTMYQIVNVDAPQPTQVNPSIPKGFDTVLFKALQKQKNKRFQSGKEFIAAIYQAKKSRPFRKYGKVLAGVYLVVTGVVISYQWWGDFDQLIKYYRKERMNQNTVTDQAEIKVPAPPTVDESIVLPDIKLPVIQFHQGEIIQDCSECPELVVIPPGQFRQGSPDSETGHFSNESPLRTVSINYPFVAGKTEVTRGEFAQYIADIDNNNLTGCWVYEGTWIKQMAFDWSNPGYEQNDQHPVTCVSWLDAQAYIQWLSQKTGQSYRLLTASEWEYIARVNDNNSRYWKGNPDLACQFSNTADRTAEQAFPGWIVYDCQDQSIYTAEVGSFKANAFGFYDLLGNVFEWVEDCWHSNYQRAPVDGSAWVQGQCDQRVLRGGSWFSQPKYVRFAFRNRFYASYRSNSFGFRIARDLIKGTVVMNNRS